jgi:hypothetical protein
LDIQPGRASYVSARKTARRTPQPYAINLCTLVGQVSAFDTPVLLIDLFPFEWVCDRHARDPPS